MYNMATANASAASLSKSISPPNAAQQVDKSKRKRGQLSCAECRRLKLRCDRVFPCESCTKRGCAAICPDGSLATKGTRFVLANTEEYHSKISDMSERIRQLETALADMHPDVPHPLLRQDLLMVKVPVELNQNVDPTSFNGETSSPVVPKASPSAEETKMPDPVVPPLLNPSGTLKLGKPGRSLFYGQTAHAQYVVKSSGKDPLEEPSQEPDPLPRQIRHMANTFFTAPKDTQAEVRQQLLDCLPPPHDLDYLVDTYYANSTWMYEPVSRESFNLSISHVLEHIHQPNEVDMHRLSLVYAILAHGSLVDYKQEMYSAQSYTYHRLSRACLAATNFIQEPSIYSVQVLFLLGFYWILSNKKDGANRGWAMQCLSTKLAQAMGLHRDLDQWDRSDRVQSEARRRAMWELLTIEGWMSLGLGRPTTCKLSEVQCKMPEVTGRALRKPSTHSWHTWKHGFAVYVARVLEKTSSVKTPPYLDILDLDRAMQAYKLPPDCQMLLNSMTPPPPPPEKVPGLDMQRCLVIQAHSTALVLLHRGFFAKALEEKDPMLSTFAPSVLATYTHAWRIVFVLQTVFDKHRELTKRYGFFWSNGFSASISLCLLVTRATHSNYASGAMQALNVLFELFTAASPECLPATRALPIITRLRDKAQAVYMPANPASRYPGRTREDEDEEDEELKALGGKTTIAQIPRPSASPQYSRFSPGNKPPGSLPMSPLPLPVTDNLQGVHPLLLEYVAQSKYVYEQDNHQGHPVRTRVEEANTRIAYDPQAYMYSHGTRQTQAHYEASVSSQTYSQSTSWNTGHTQGEQTWGSTSYAGHSDTGGQVYEQYQYQQQPHYSTNPSLQSYSEATDGNQYGAWKAHMEQLGLPF